MEIASGIYQLQVPIPDNPLGHLNAYVVRGTAGWLMIDTGWHTPDAFNALKSGLEDLGLDVTDISKIVLTHVHPDHFGLAGRIKHLSPRTDLLAHRWESDLIESRYIKFSELQDKVAAMLERHGAPEADLSSLRSASMPALQFVTVTLPDHILYGGETISTGVYDLEVIWTPGHSPGHICLYEPKNRLLFSGDHILPTITPNIAYHVQSGDNPLGDYECSLHKVENLPVAKVLPGHQQIFTDLRGRIEGIIAHHDKRSIEILHVIAGKPSNAFEISSRVVWNVPGLTWEQYPPLQRRFAVTETIAHLERMRWQGRVKKTIESGRVLYG